MSWVHIPLNGIANNPDKYLGKRVRQTDQDGNTTEGILARRNAGGFSIILKDGTPHGSYAGSARWQVWKASSYLARLVEAEKQLGSV